MILAGDIGGTKTLLGLFERGDERPRPLFTHSYPTNDFPSFSAILDAFARDAARPLSIAAAALGVAGPVLGGTARLTNIAWGIAADEGTRKFETDRKSVVEGK